MEQAVGSAAGLGKLQAKLRRKYRTNDDNALRRAIRVYEAAKEAEALRVDTIAALHTLAAGSVATFGRAFCRKMDGDRERRANAGRHLLLQHLPAILSR